MKTLMILTMVYQGWFSETMTINTEVVTKEACEAVKQAYTKTFPAHNDASAYVMCIEMER